MTCLFDNLYGKAVEIRDRIKKLFGRHEADSVIETSQRYNIPTGFIDNQETVFAAILKRNGVNSGARLYTYKQNGVSLEKICLGDMNEAEWVDFKSRLNKAKINGIEYGKFAIPTSLSEGKRGVYATKVKRFNGVEFVEDGVNIYQTDENMRNIFVRSMNAKKWHNFSLLIEKAKEEEKAIREAGIAKFIALENK